MIRLIHVICLTRFDGNAEREGLFFSMLRIIWFSEP